MNLSSFSMPSKIAAGCALAGFAVSIRTVDKSVENGVITHCAYTGYRSLILGAAALAGAVLALGQAAFGRDRRSAVLGAAAGLVGAWHAVSGAGLVGQPCA